MGMFGKVKGKAKGFYRRNRPYIYGGLGFAGGAVLSGGNPMAALAGGVAGYGLGQQEQNYQNQVENQEYLRGLQERIFAREDTSVGRRMEDLRAAGINPILAAGQGADAGSMIKTDPAQREDQALQNVMNIMRMDADISQTRAQTLALGQQIDLNQAQAERLRLQNKIENQLAPLQANLITSQARNQISSAGLSVAQRNRALLDTDIAARDFQINQMYGLPSHGGGSYSESIRTLMAPRTKFWELMGGGQQPNYIPPTAPRNRGASAGW